jgi:hypothetical protein
MVSVYAITGCYALKEEHGKQLADIDSSEGFDFAKVEIFCSNFWAGFFCDLKSFLNVKLWNFPSHQFNSVEKIIKSILEKDKTSILRFSLDFEVYPHNHSHGTLLISIKDDIQEVSEEDILYSFAVEDIHGKETLEQYLRDYPRLAAELIDLSYELSREDFGHECELSLEDKALIEQSLTKFHEHLSLLES